MRKPSTDLFIPMGPAWKRELAHQEPLSHSSPKPGLEWGTQQLLPLWQKYVEPEGKLECAAEVTCPNHADSF
jgi:hypothetical protein